MDRELVENVATPEPLRVPVPRFVTPSRKVTVPPGMPKPLVTVAVRVTLVPKAAGLLFVTREVVVG